MIKTALVYGAQDIICKQLAFHIVKGGGRRDYEGHDGEDRQERRGGPRLPHALEFSGRLLDNDRQVFVNRRKRIVQIDEHLVAYVFGMLDAFAGEVLNVGQASERSCASSATIFRYSEGTSRRLASPTLPKRPKLGSKCGRPL